MGGRKKSDDYVQMQKCDKNDDSDKWVTTVDPTEYAYTSYPGDSTSDNSVDKWAAPVSQVEYPPCSKDDDT